MGKRSFFPRLALVNLVRNSRYYGPYLLSCGSLAAMYYILRFLTWNEVIQTVRGRRLPAGHDVHRLLCGGAVFRGAAAVCQQLRDEAAAEGTGALQHSGPGKAPHRRPVRLGDAAVRRRGDPRRHRGGHFAQQADFAAAFEAGADPCAVRLFRQHQRYGGNGGAAGGTVPAGASMEPAAPGAVPAH